MWKRLLTHLLNERGLSFSNLEKIIEVATCLNRYKAEQTEKSAIQICQRSEIIRQTAPPQIRETR